MIFEIDMNKETRIDKISEIVEIANREESKLLKWEIPWEGSLQRMSVYNVPLKYLIYNKYNGRILSRTKSLESQGKELKPEDEGDKEIIEDLLWESNVDRNKKTRELIKEYGQEKVGIITKDGIIIDGNRRAMLLGKLEREYFKTVILPVTSGENPLEIEKLETSYQMGEDEKLRYNPTEKYIKAKKLQQQGVPIKEIAKWMGEPDSVVKEYLEVIKTMDNYLDYLEYSGVYTQLDGREDQFINLTKWLNNFYEKGSGKAFEGYKNSDVDDLKAIAFDYIRVKCEGKQFRYLAYGRKEKHFFGDKDLWESFKDTHFSNIDPIRDEEEPINFDSPNLTATLNNRDKEFEKAAGNLLIENMDEHKQKLYNQQHRDKPGKLIDQSIDAVRVAKSNKNIREPDVLDKVGKLNEMTANILKAESPRRLLGQILSLLHSVDVSGGASEKDELLQYTSEIQKKTYKLEKAIKRLE